ncbi:type II secretion system protein D [Aeromonas hydrophila]|uniref:secretin N-terminal domain-containing protein n=1 Tax=Aeromonas hydrophila TaxID=644 RepID=UPI001F25164F|nr:secretin N-terminal domain-containing protein [Aeromonas hydrophila]
MARRFSLTLVCSAVLTGCAATPIVGVQPVIESQNSSVVPTTVLAEKKINKQINPAQNITQSVRSAPLLRSQDRDSVSAAKLVLPTGTLSLSADKMPINDFINLALGEVLELNYIVDQSLQSKTEPVTLRVIKPVDARRLLGLVEEVLQVNGVALALEDGVVKVIPAEKTANAIPTIVSGTVQPALRYGKVVEIIPIFYLPLGQATTLAERMVKESSGTVLMQNNLNALMVIAKRDEIDQLQKILAEVDIPNRVASHLAVVQPSFLTLEELTADLVKALDAASVPVSLNKGVNGVVLVPMSNNTLLVTASTQAWLEYTRDWVRRLDKPRPTGGSDGVYAYFLKNTKVADTWAVVSSIFGDGNTSSSQKEPGEDLLAAAEQVRDQQNATGTARASDRSLSSEPGNRGAIAPKKMNTQTMSVMTEQYRVVVDAKRNALIFSGRYSDYQRLVELLQFVDQRPRQVLLQAVIAEVKVTNDSSLGFEWNITKGDITGGTTGLIGKTGNLNLNGVFGDVTAKFSAALSEGNAKVLSSPRLVVLDQETASIKIGDQIVVKTGEISNGSGGSGDPQVTTSYKYIDTGLSLEITPSINDDGLIEMTIAQEISSVSAGGGDTPPINRRAVQSKLLADSGKTVYLGGLLSQNKTDNEEKVPLLGDIPVLGNLFKYQTKKHEKTELVLLITPFVITSKEEADFYTDQFRTLSGWDPMPKRNGT